MNLPPIIQWGSDIMGVKHWEMAFNNKVESWLRALAIIYNAYPAPLDLERLLYLDYLTVHSGDIPEEVLTPWMESLHAPTPNRWKEIFVRRMLLEEGLELLISKWLVEKTYGQWFGIRYVATDSASPFLWSLWQCYSQELLDRSSVLVKRFADWSIADLRWLIRSITHT